MDNILHTKWGSARISHDGYYVISSRVEGNRGKKLHRLIYEDFWGVKLPKEISIHHKDGNKLNNCILNLEAMYNTHHAKLHHKDKKLKLSHKLKMSRAKNTSGYFRVYKKKVKTLKQGYYWVYRYIDENDGKRKDILSKTIEELEKKVLEKGLKWVSYNG